jgi:hypothetical protein
MGFKALSFKGDLMHNIFYADNAILPQCLQAKDKQKEH